MNCKSFTIAYKEKKGYNLLEERTMKAKIEKKQLVFDDYFKVEEAFVRYEKFNGQMTEPVRRLNFERGDAAAALVFNRDSGKVILINQFRYPTLEKNGGWMLETAAGIVETGEDPKETICREILEEIGYETQPGQLEAIASFFPSPGGSSERIFLYYIEVENAAKQGEGGGVETEHEDIQTVELTLDELWNAMEQGNIHDAKTLIAVQWLKNREP